MSKKIKVRLIIQYRRSACTNAPKNRKPDFRTLASMAPSTDAMGTVTEQTEHETYWGTLAQTHWKKAPVKARNDVIKNEIWDVLEKDNFSHRSLLILESLQALEK